MQLYESGYTKSEEYGGKTGPWGKDAHNIIYGQSMGFSKAKPHTASIRGLTLRL